MKYTYKRECVIADRGDLVHIVLLLIWVCATLAVFGVDGYLVFVKGEEGNGGPVVGGLFALAAAAIGISVYRDIRKRRKPALEFRRKAMEIGSRYSGKIVEAGKKRESVAYEWSNDDNTTETRYSKEWNYWVDVEYWIPQEEEPRRFRAEHMSKNMQSCVGREVDAYMWYEWSSAAQMNLTLTYIDAGVLS